MIRSTPKACLELSINTALQKQVRATAESHMLASICSAVAPAARLVCFASGLLMAGAAGYVAPVAAAVLKAPDAHAKPSGDPAANYAALLESGGGRYDPPSDHIDPIIRGKLLAGAARVRTRLGLDGPTYSQQPARAKGFGGQTAGLSPLASSAGSPRLLWPVRPGADNRHDFQTGVSNYVDLDSVTGSLLDYACGSRTYDRPDGYNHNGVDISSWPYPWTVMDQDGLDVVAAAEGIIISKVGGEADRSCTTNTDADWNLIVLAHSDGKQTLYGHLKRDSLTRKSIGDSVAAGEYLGQVGSSGVSTGPHLHFELLDGNNNNLDPFAGACGAQDSHWRWQPEYNKSRVNAVLVGNAAPVIGDCDGTENPNPGTEFEPGDPVFVSGFFVNQAQGDAARMRLIAPEGNVWLDVAMGSPPEAYAFSYWYRSFIAPPIAGQWRALVTLNGETSEAGFTVGEPAREGLLVAAVLPGSRSVGLNESASVFASVANGGAVALEGCRVLPLGPFAGQLSYQATDPATNALTGQANEPVSIPVGGARSFVLTLDPVSTVAPSTVEFNFKCNNAPRARSVRGLNTLQFSAAATAPPDILPISATANGDGVVRLNGSSGMAAFATAAVNIGAIASGVVVTPLAEGLNISMSVCETDSAGLCKALPTGNVVVDFGSAPRTFSVFVSGSGDSIAFDPENNRAELRFEHNGQVRGVTSVAITTN